MTDHKFQIHGWVLDPVKCCEHALARKTLIKCPRLFSLTLFLSLTCTPWGPSLDSDSQTGITFFCFSPHLVLDMNTSSSGSSLSQTTGTGKPLNDSVSHAHFLHVHSRCLSSRQYSVRVIPFPAMSTFTPPMSFRD